MRGAAGLSETLFGLLDLMDKLDRTDDNHARIRHILLGAFEDVADLKGEGDEVELELELVSEPLSSTTVH